MLSASTWGNPNSTQRVLLLHGLISWSCTWHHVASEFASKGYYVFAPDLLGHGNAGHGSDHSVTALADELRPVLAADHPYDIVVGHSLGAIVTSALLPLLKSNRSVRVVLVDPPFELNAEQFAYHKTFIHFLLKDERSLDDFQEKLPLSTKEDAVFGWLGTRLCNITTADGIINENVPWSFSHLLSTIPENVKVTVLAADPSKIDACVKVEEMKKYPQVTSKTVWGASHVIPVDAPHAIIDAALEGTEAQN